MATQADIERLQAELARRQGLNVGNSQYMSSSQATNLSNQLSAVEATPTVEYQSPTNVNLNTGMGSATTAMGLVDNQIKNLEAEKKTADDYLTAQGATGNSFYEKLTSMLGNKPKADTQGVLSDQQAKYGIDDQLNTLKGQNLKVAGLQGDIQKLETEEMTAIDRAEGRVASRGAIEGEKETITRDYNIKKAYKYAELYAEAAVATAMSGNLNESRNLVKDAVDAYTYDIEQKISQFDEMFSVASSWVSALDTKEQNLLQTKRTELQAEADQLKQDKTAIGNLMIEYNQYGAGIKLTDTLEEAQAKAGSVSTQGTETQMIGDSTSGYKLINTKTGEVIQNYSGSGIGGGGDGSVATGETTKAVQNAQTVLDQIKTIEASSGKVYGITSYLGNIAGTKQFDYKQQVTRLKNLLTIENLGIMKGVLSDADIKILTGAATALDVKMTKEAFLTELEKIKSKMSKIVSNGTTTMIGNDPLGLFD